MAVIRMEHVDFGYGDGRTVLHDINLEIDGPGYYCIVGPNGVGKSTLVKCMNRIVEPTAGRVTIDGRDVAEMTRREIAGVVGYVPVASEDAFAMSVVDTILVGRFNGRRWGSDTADLQAVYRAMKLMHIRNLASRNFSELSAGQRQKVSIARGIVARTPVLILDEPTANLDVQFQVYVAELLRAYAARMRVAVVMISHDLNIAAKYAHRVIMLERPGTVRSVGSPAEVITEKNVEEVYGVDCDVVSVDGHPVVLLGSAVIGEDDDWDAGPAGGGARLATAGARRGALRRALKARAGRRREPPGGESRFRPALLPISVLRIREDAIRSQADAPASRQRPAGVGFQV